MKEQHKLKMVVDYEAGKIRGRRAAELPGIMERHFRRLDKVVGYFMILPLKMEEKPTILVTPRIY